MKGFSYLMLCLVFALNIQYTFAQHKFKMPDIAGYKTLVCDFHSHTIYSDGSVLPSVRVDEALMEGVDVVAVTEHIEDYCRKIPETKNEDLNTSYNHYVKAAEGSNLIVIRGGEISRGMPPGHLNALFLTDVNPLDTEHTDEGIWKAIEIAIQQGAFIIWNHPGWKWQAPNGAVWYDFHTKLYEKGWLHGIEISNYKDGAYPQALGWYSKYQLTPISGADTHGPSAYDFDLIHSHKPVTLVFAKERSVEGVKEALFARRSLAYDSDSLYGAQPWLKAFFEASVTVTPDRMKTKAHTKTWTVTNSSDIPYKLVLNEKPKGVEVAGVLTIAPHQSAQVAIKTKREANITLSYTCENLIYADKAALPVTLTFTQK